MRIALAALAFICALCAADPRLILFAAAAGWNGVLLWIIATAYHLLPWLFAILSASLALWLWMMTRRVKKMAEVMR